VPTSPAEAAWVSDALADLVRADFNHFGAMPSDPGDRCEMRPDEAKPWLADKVRGAILTWGHRQRHRFPDREVLALSRDGTLDDEVRGMLLEDGHLHVRPENDAEVLRLLHADLLALARSGPAPDGWWGFLSCEAEGLRMRSPPRQDRMAALDAGRARVIE